MMYKFLLTFLPCLFVVVFGNNCFGQSQASNQYLSLVLELESNSPQTEISARILSRRILDGRLKKPTVSEKESKDVAINDVFVRFLSEQGKICKEFAYSNPFYTNYEYVNEENNLEHVVIPESKKAYLIRIPFDAKIKFIEVTRKEITGSNQVFHESIF